MNVGSKHGGGWVSGDRRQQPRTRILLSVEYRDADGLLRDYLSDLGEGGLFIRTDREFAVGERVTFSVAFPSLLHPLTLEGIVRWRREPDPDTGEPRKGVGVEFVFDDASKRQQVKDLVQRVSQPGVPRQRYRVLLVEDNVFVQELFGFAVARFHRQLGGGVPLMIQAVEDGYEGLDVVKRSRPGDINMAIVDHFLPGPSGLELVGYMRQSAAFVNVPIVVISVGEPGLHERALQAGADLYLEKPILLKELLHTLHLLASLPPPG